MEISQKNHQGADQTTEKDTDQTTEQYCPVTDLYERYNLKKAMVYTRLNFLHIKPTKFGVRSFLSQEQLAHMDALHDYIRENGGMDGYPIPESSGSWEEKALLPNEEEVNESNSAITVSESKPLNNRNFAPTGERTHAVPEIETVANLVRSAQNKAAGVLIAENFLANQYIQNPESLPDNLKEKIKESAQTPVIDPFAYANSLIDFVQAGEAVG